MKTDQSAVHRCDRCGQSVPVTALTAYEFTWDCRCGSAGTIAWAHASPAPRFLHEAQESLFPAEAR